MKLKYFGTAAAEGFPGMFCECDTCNRARKSGGKNIRTRSQALIDDRLLIDLPADTYLHCLNQDLPLTKIQHCIITHNHSDHFYPADLEMRSGVFAQVEKDSCFHIYGTDSVYDHAAATLKELGIAEGDRIRLHRIEPFQSFHIDHYTITPIPANHDPKATPVIYLIEDGKSTLLYAHDTGILSDSVWNWLKESEKKIDFVSLDCTGGILTGWTNGHLGLDTGIRFREMLTAAGVADQNTKFCLNHFSHNGLVTYDDFLPIAEKEGFDVSFDGKEVEF